jgi:hypothetical protein
VVGCSDHISESSVSPAAREGNGATPNPTAAAMQLSDRTKPFKRKEAAQFKLRKRIFPSSWRREGAASSTSPAVLANVTVSLSSRRQPFQRNQPSDFKLRKRTFNSSSRKPSLSAESDSRRYACEHVVAGEERLADLCNPECAELVTTTVRSTEATQVSSSSGKVLSPAARGRRHRHR